MYFIATLINTFVFALCVAIMWGVSGVTGATYKEVCVVGNVYLQGLIIALSSLFVLNGAMKSSENRKEKITWSTIYVIFNFIVFGAILNHYGFNLTEAFDKCKNELVYVSRCFAQCTPNPTEDDWYADGLQFNTELFYIHINVIFFVYAFIATIFVNYRIGKRLKGKPMVVPPALP